MKFKKRHIRKAIRIARTGNWKHFTKPKVINFVPTLKCNLNCKMCHQTDIKRCGEREMTLEEIAHALDNLKAQGITQLNVVGGELFVNKERAWKILDMIEERSFLFSIATNCFNVLEEDVTALSLYWGLVEFDVSLDGVGKVHDSIRGVPGAYKKTIEFIKNAKQHGIPVMSVTVVQKDNLKNLEDLVVELKKANVDTATFVTEYTVSPKEIKDTKTILSKMGIDDVTIFSAYSIDEHCFKYTPEDFKYYVNKAFKKCDEIGLEHMTSFNLDKFEYFYDKSAYKLFNCSCNCLNGIGQVDWTGSLSICPFLRVNNGLYATGLIDDELLQNKLIKIQKQIEKDLLPMCSHCCSFTIGEKK